LPYGVLFGVVFFAYEWWRWATLQSTAYDLAYFDQVVWNASQGHGFVSSFASYPFFGQHFSPALAALVPLYVVSPSPLWLLAAQSLALGAALAPVYKLAERLLGGRVAPLAGAAYVLQLFILRAVNFDFHTEALAVPFVFWAVLAAVRDQRLVLLLAGLVPLLCKEDGALVSLGVGFLAWAVFKRRAGLVLMGVALIYGLVVMLVVMPFLRHGAPGDLFWRYGYLGQSAPAILTSLVTRPQLVIGHLLTPAPLGALTLILAGLGFLPLLRPLALAAALPALLLALLSTHVPQETLADHYGLQAGPLLFTAALLGWRRVRSPAIPGVALLVAAAFIALVWAPRPTLAGWDRAHDAATLAARIPPRDAVAASSQILPRLAHRSSISLFPNYDASWVLIDRTQTGPAEITALRSHGYVEADVAGDYSLWRRPSDAYLSY
jgi:uncharacterized membrane protein